jgi:hypothetical protein
MADTWEIKPSSLPRDGGNPGGTLASVAKAKGTVNLGGLKNTAAISENTIEGEYTTNVLGEKLKYPEDLESIEACPAKMTFSIYEVTSYSPVPESKEEMLALGELVRRSASKSSESIASEAGNLNEKRVAGGTAKDITPNVGNTDDAYNIGAAGEFGNIGQSREENITKKISDAEIQAAEDLVASGKSGDIQVTKVKGAPSIQLYLPPGLQYNDDVNYNNVDLGPGGVGAIAALQSGSSVASAISKGLFDGLTSIFNLAAGSLSGDVANVALARAANNFLPGASLKAAATQALQVNVNPNTRTMFDRPNLRQFNFAFKLVATSPSEARQIEKIVKSFRKYMYPEAIKLGQVPIGYRFPPMFKIDFDYRGSKVGIPSILHCHLKSVQANYNQQSGTFHEDGQPTEVDLNLVFLEYRALTQQDIERGY